MLKLLVSIQGQAREVALKDAVNFIGRAASCQIRLTDGIVAEQHARIERNGGDYTLSDLNTKHGTMVNGRKVTAAKLASGDEISIGLATMTVTSIQRPATQNVPKAAPAAPPPAPAAPEPARARPSRTPREIPRKSPVGAIVTVVLVLGVIGGGGYAGWSYLTNRDKTPTPAPVVTPRKDGPREAADKAFGSFKARTEAADVITDEMLT
jgi:hypothetical protein